MSSAEAVIESFKQVAIELGMQRAAAALVEAMSPGGKGYEQIMRGAIAGANNWYGMYSPKVYKRGYSLTDRGNIDISISGPTISGTTIEMSYDVRNISPHIGWTAGFMMRNGETRPGGDVLAMVPNHIEIPWNPSAEDIKDIVEQAQKILFG